MSNFTGATSLAATIRTLLATTKAQLDKAGNELTDAVGELQATADHAVAQVKIVKSETADLRAALGLSSNGGPLLDDSTLLPKVEYETPPPFTGPALPPPLHADTGDVNQIKLDNGEPKIGFM